MVIEKWTGPPVETHTYLVADETSGEAWIIDAPLETAASVLARVRERGLNLTRVVLTHAHFDHVLDAERYQEANVPLALHPADFELLQFPQASLFGLPYAMPSVVPSEELQEGQKLTLGHVEWEVWHVPGHAPGHVILYSAAESCILGGDLLFRQGYGRVDLPGADPAAMVESLRRLLSLPDETRVYPGHGPDTTLSAERGWLEPMLLNPMGARL